MCCLHHQDDDGGSTYLWNVGRQLFYTVVHPRRQIWTTFHCFSIFMSYRTQTTTLLIIVPIHSTLF
jgi:hypothetical protein